MTSAILETETPGHSIEGPGLSLKRLTGDLDFEVSRVGARIDSNLVPSWLAATAAPGLAGILRIAVFRDRGLSCRFLSKNLVQ